MFRDNQAADQVILGATGYGKTVFLNAIALRAAAEGYRVIGLDAFRNGDRVAAAADGGARCYSLGLDTPINLLDVVVADEPGEPPGSWLGKQVQAVIGQLGLLLGEPGVGPDGREQYLPRRFSTTERGVLDRALLTLYQTWTVGPATPQEQMPLLSDLIDILAQIGVREAQELARDLRILLFGADAPGDHEPTTLGRSFNTRTAVDWDFEHSDITYFDFSRVPALLKAFYYIQAIGAVRRWMRDPRRDLRRKTLLQLDEFGYAAQVAAVLQLAVELCKTARKYGVGLMLTVAVRIGEVQRQYVALGGCGACAGPNTLQRCAPGCPVELLRRLLRVVWPACTLTAVPHGLAPRAYTRLLWLAPTLDTAPLDAAALAPWGEARLTLHWRSGPNRVADRGPAGGRPGGAASGRGVRRAALAREGASRCGTTCAELRATSPFIPQWEVCSWKT